MVASDDGSPFQAGRFDLTVTVTPINEPPSVIGQTSHSVNENSETFAASYSASDPEGSSTTLSWSLSGTDGGDFTITQSGQLTFRNTPDHERPADSNRNNEYLVSVRASDGQYTGTLDVTITVNNINEAPTITSDATLTYPENTAITRVLDRYTANDPERGQITWSLGGDEQNDFLIDQSGNLTFASVPDYEIPSDSDRNREYRVTVVASDDGSPSQAGRFDLTVTVTPVNEPPSVNGQPSHSVDETPSPLLPYTPPATRRAAAQRSTGPSPAPTAATSLSPRAASSHSAPHPTMSSPPTPTATTSTW